MFVSALPALMDAADVGGAIAFIVMCGNTATISGSLAAMAAPGLAVGQTGPLTTHDDEQSSKHRESGSVP